MCALGRPGRRTFDKTNLEPYESQECCEIDVRCNISNQLYHKSAVEIDAGLMQQSTGKPSLDSPADRRLVLPICAVTPKRFESSLSISLLLLAASSSLFFFP